MAISMFFYLITYAIHIVAFLLGLECLRRGEKLFESQRPAIDFDLTRLEQGKNPFTFHFDEQEMQYWIVNIGTSVNFVFLLILPIYATNNMGFLHVWEELAFNYVHFGTGFITTIMHCLTLQKVNNRGTHQHVGKDT